MKYRVLVIGTADDVVALSPTLAGLGVQSESLPWETCESLRNRPEPIVIALASRDIVDCASLFCRLRRRWTRQTMLLLVRAEDSELFAGAIEAADDFAITPIRGDELALRLARLARGAVPESVEACRHLREELALAQLVGSDERFVEVLGRIPLFARAEMPVLIIGETGTGKELCARAVHFLSARRSAPFIAVDCSALPDHLFENELFGHARGAYTDAHADQRGLVALSEHGTLFLDEVDSLSLATQGKLLRFLQEKTWKPLGGEKFLRADVTVIAATNRDLEESVRQKQFRADLFYRLNVLEIRMPPLRERRDDIPLLARHFIAEKKTLSSPALRRLTEHDWPGNVRELWNVVQRACVLAEGDVVLPCHIMLPTADERDAPPRGKFRAAKTKSIEAFERAYVHEILLRHGGNISHAAREAGQERRAFGKLVKKYGLQRGLSGPGG